jgi:hypothetical protein
MEPASFQLGCRNLREEPETVARVLHGVKTEPRSASKLRTSDKSNCLREPVCRLCADTSRGVLLARKVGQIVRRGTRIWLVRVHDGRDPESAKRKYLNQTIHGGLHDAQAHLNEMLSERDRGRSLDSSKQILNQYLDEWLELCARPRLRTNSRRAFWTLKDCCAATCGLNLARNAANHLRAQNQTLDHGLLARSLSARSIRYATHSCGRHSGKRFHGTSFW